MKNENDVEDMRDGLQRLASYISIRLRDAKREATDGEKDELLEMDSDELKEEHDRVSFEAAYESGREDAFEDACRFMYSKGWIQTRDERFLEAEERFFELQKIAAHKGAEDSSYLEIIKAEIARREREEDDGED